MTRLKGLLVEAEENVSVVGCKVSEAASEMVKAFGKGEDFCQELLESCKDGYVNGIQWCKGEVAKCSLEFDLGGLSLGVLSSNTDLDGSGADVGGEAMSSLF